MNKKQLQLKKKKTFLIKELLFLEKYRQLEKLIHTNLKITLGIVFFLMKSQFLVK